MSEKFDRLVERAGDPGSSVLAVPGDEAPRMPVTWVVIRGASSQDVYAKCTRCLVKLFIPDGTPAPRFDDLLTGFCVDHRGCQERP